MDTWGVLTNATNVIGRDDVGSIRRKDLLVSKHKAFAFVIETFF